MKKNDETISIAKGICIILVVLGHCTPLGAANNLMYQFHVPLFFFVAGYFFSEKKAAKPFEFIKRRITGLYVPYLKYALFFLLIHNILVSLHVMSDYYDISTWLYRLYLITTHFSGHDEMLGGFWFIKELFVVSVLYLFLRNYIAKSSKQIIEVLFILLFIAIVMSHFEIEIPWLQFSHRTVVGLFLFGLGEVAHRLNISNWYDTKMALLAMPLMIVSAICGRFYFESSNTNIIVFLALAVVGIYCCLSLSKYIKYRGGVFCRLLNYAGQNTLTILGLHFITFKLVSFLYIEWMGWHVSRLEEFPGLKDCYSFLWPIYSIVGIFVPLLFVYTWKIVKRKVANRNV